MKKYQIVKNVAKKLYDFLNHMWHFYKVLNMRKISGRAEKLLSYYQDDISIKWLRAREKYYEDGDLTIFSKVERSLGKGREYHIEEMEADGVVIIYKEKNDLPARYARQVVKMSSFGKKCRFISENEYKNSFGKLTRNNEVLVPAMSKENIVDFLSAVRAKGDWSYLFIPQYGILLGTVGWQYFDMFPSDRDEVVVDAGVFDGKTETEIFRWGGVNVKKIYAFEADPANFRQCRKYYEENALTDKVEFIGKGLWNKKSVMRIGSGQSSAGSSVGAKGESEIEVTTLDSEVGEDKVTFIKMDIEGAELNALKGAKATIMKNKPRLAICIYHKPEDLYEIPEYLLSIVPEYKFWIRHYTSNNWETVLYAKCQ